MLARRVDYWTRDQLRSNLGPSHLCGTLTDLRRAILHVVFRRGSNVTKAAISAEVGVLPKRVSNELTQLEIGGYIELNPLRMTHAGCEVVRGYS